MNPGERIGPYRIVQRLGEGGIGEVFRAVDETLAREVAIKRLRPELAEREQLVARFRAEAQTLARLNHPHIATLYALEHSDGAMCMVMEYVEGETIAALLRERGPLELEPALRLGIQALDGIGYAHARGVIHRDIKGSNLMLDTAGTLKVMDFGIARVLGEQRQTRAGQLVGTPEFMAPEQIRGEDADERSDLYSLGILIFALISGRGPFRAHSEYDLMKAQVEAAAPSLREVCPEAPAELAAVLGRARAKRPEDRFQSAAELREALESLAEHPTPIGEFVWPVRASSAEAETSLLTDTGVDPDAATLESDPVSPERALPLIDAELIAEPRPTVAETHTRGPRWGWLPWLAALGFAVGVVIGLDVLETRRSDAGESPSHEAPGEHLGPEQGPLAARPDRPADPHEGPHPGDLPPATGLVWGADEAPGAQAGDENGRFDQQTPRRPKSGRSGGPRTQGAQGENEWVIRRR
ncbi:MAG: serine/threonine-protein kinase [Myxococcota bacterium]|nr:serine/threonine-protein kinase [Myxococcota bacterium]